MAPNQLLSSPKGQAASANSITIGVLNSRARELSVPAKPSTPSIAVPPSAALLHHLQSPMAKQLRIPLPHPHLQLISVLFLQIQNQRNHSLIIYIFLLQVWLQLLQLKRAQLSFPSPVSFQFPNAQAFMPCSSLVAAAIVAQPS